MLCFYHKERIAISRCELCQKPLCGLCESTLKGKTLCQDCVKLDIPELQFVPRRNPTLAAVLSTIVPGGGQVYNGQLGKGLIILFTFWLIIPWIYGIVDAFLTARKINKNLVALRLSVDHILGFFFLVILLCFGAYRLYDFYTSSEYDYQFTKETLLEISNALESFYKEEGRYPQDLKELYFSGRDYLDELQCDGELAGFIYSCEFTKKGYTITAESKIKKKKATLIVSTGGVFHSSGDN